MLLALAVWAIGQLAGALTTGRWPQVPPGQAWGIALNLPGHLGDPRDAWPAAVRGQLPGPVPFYTVASLLLVGTGTVVAAVVVTAVRHRRDPRTADRDHSPVWARPAQVRHLLVRGRPGQRIVLGRLGRRGPTVAVPARRSVMVVAPTQTGKTTRIVIPTVLTWTGPLVVTSVKTDVLNLTHAERARRGAVHVFDPTGATGRPTTHWSPLLGCGTYPGAERTAAWLVEAAGEPRPGENTAFWETLGAKLLGPLLYAAAASAGGIEQVSRWVDRRTTTEVTEVLKLLGDTDALDAWAASCAREERQRDSVYATAETILRAFASPTARAATRIDADGHVEGTVLDVDRLIRRGDTLYLVAPAHEQQRLRPLFQALVQDVIRAAQDAYAATGVPLDPPLLLMLDEAANIAPLRDLALHAATGAGQGIQICSVWQDLAQVSTVYGRKAPTVINGHTARVFLPGSADLATLEATSKMIGDHEHTRGSTTHAADGTQTVSAAAIEARVAPVEYLRQLPADTAVVLHGRDPVLRLHTTPWYADPALRALVDPAAAEAADKAAQPTRTAGSRRLRVPRCPRGRPPDPSTDPYGAARADRHRRCTGTRQGRPPPRRRHGRRTHTGLPGQERIDMTFAPPSLPSVESIAGTATSLATRLAARASRRGLDRPLHRCGGLRGSRRPGPSRRERRSRPRGPPGRRGRVPRRHRVPRRPPRHPHAGGTGHAPRTGHRSSPWPRQRRRSPPWPGTCSPRSPGSATCSADPDDAGSRPPGRPARGQRPRLAHPGGIRCRSPSVSSPRWPRTICASRPGTISPPPPSRSWSPSPALSPPVPPGSPI